ncbi:MAG: hypothetical protein NUW37_19275 [Planctomycetes bacterium]|nr:hypothetical protein [Planctomycetota bacterium]
MGEWNLQKAISGIIPKAEQRESESDLLEKAKECTGGFIIIVDYNSIILADNDRKPKFGITVKGSNSLILFLTCSAFFHKKKPEDSLSIAKNDFREQYKLVRDTVRECFDDNKIGTTFRDEMNVNGTSSNRITEPSNKEDSSSDVIQQDELSFPISKLCYDGNVLVRLFPEEKDGQILPVSKEEVKAIHLSLKLLFIFPPPRQNSYKIFGEFLKISLCIPETSKKFIFHNMQELKKILPSEKPSVQNDAFNHISAEEIKRLIAEAQASYIANCENTSEVKDKNAGADDTPVITSKERRMLTNSPIAFIVLLIIILVLLPLAIWGFFINGKTPSDNAKNKDSSPLTPRYSR